MEKQFATYEIALELKKLKFDRPCLAAFEDFTCDKKLVIATQIQIELFGGYTVKSLYRDDCYAHILAPLWQQVIDWFYEKHNIEITYGFTVNYKNSPYIFDICKFNRDLHGREISYDGSFGCQKLNFTSKEEAREAAIRKAIELCQRK